MESKKPFTGAVLFKEEDGREVFHVIPRLEEQTLGPRAFWSLQALGFAKAGRCCLFPAAPRGCRTPGLDAWKAAGPDSGRCVSEGSTPHMLVSLAKFTG